MTIRCGEESKAHFVWPRNSVHHKSRLPRSYVFLMPHTFFPPFLSKNRNPNNKTGGGAPGSARPRVSCRACGDGSAVRRVPLPHVFRFLAAELAAMNIKTVLTLTE